MLRTIRGVGYRLDAPPTEPGERAGVGEPVTAGVGSG
jgi:hypothetical protein